MIPTRHKAKLPKALSWPLGAEAITAGLADAPHAGDFELWFAAAPIFRQSEFQQIVRAAAAPYPVLVAEHTPPALALMNLGEQWEVRVNPVPRPVRSVVGGRLREHGLPAVVEWLRSSDRAGWNNRIRRLELLWSPALGTLSQTHFESS